MLIRPSALLSTCKSILSSVAAKVTPGLANHLPCASISVWRYHDYGAKSAVWPNYKPEMNHHKHQRHRVKPFSEGIMKMTKVRVVDNSKIGMEAMALGKFPKVIHVYSKRHLFRPHGAYGKLGDRVKVAILGEVRQGIIVGVKQKQLPGVPAYDTNNIVLINDDGSPLGTKITVPIPYQLRHILSTMSHYKKPDYTKVLNIATEFV